MAQPLLLVPLDDRPPNYLFPQRIASIAGEQLILPPREMLGQFLRPGDTTRVAAWLVEQARMSGAPAALVAADMVVYGGLVASRSGLVDQNEALRRTEVFLEVKRANPALRLMVASVIMRISITASDERVAQYYQDLIRYSELSWLTEHAGRSDLLEEYQQVVGRIPADVLDQYLAARRRNHQVNRQMIKLLAQGVIDDLILIQEDASQAGPHLAEHRSLRSLARSLNAEERFHLYPGADEGTQTLLARWLNRAITPNVQVCYSSIEGAQQVAPFEDRPVCQTVAGHLNAAGVNAVEGEQPTSKTDRAVLWVHTPCTSEETLRAAREIEAMIQGGVRLGLADVRFPNGGDPEIMNLLCQAGVLPKLTAYAGWNTAGNTLGTAIATLCAALAGQRSGLSEKGTGIHQRFLWERFVDDWGYQRITRPQIETRLREQGLDPFNLGASQQAVEHEVSVKLSAWAEQLAANCGWPSGAPNLHVRLPWPRTFEVEVDAHSLEAAPGRSASYTSAQPSASH